MPHDLHGAGARSEKKQPVLWRGVIGVRPRRFAIMAVILLVSCADVAHKLAATSSTVGSQLTPDTKSTIQANDPLSRILPSTPGACIVAIRTADGRYLSRPATVAVSKATASKDSRTARFAYRGWAAGADSPVLLAVCTIPDDPAETLRCSARLHRTSESRTARQCV